MSLRVPQTTKQSLLATNVGKCSYVAEAANAIGSTIVGSSFSGSLTLVEMGHIRIGSAGNGQVRLVAQPSAIVGGCEDQGHAVVNLGDQLVGVRRDDREGANPLARTRVPPVNAPIPKGLPSCMAMAYGCLAFCL